MYKKLKIDKEKLTIMGVRFPNLKTLEIIANSIGSNMYEGFEPTKKGIKLIRDYTTGKITVSEFIKASKEKKYV